jgi:DNA invertase Pin-like site-specific DNA recombinase
MSEIEKIGYTRVSTLDQDPENQIRILLSEGIPSDYIFVDKGISGTIAAEKRPGFIRAMKYIEDHPGCVKYIYVYEISRLGRTMLETVNLIAKLEKMGIMVWSLSPNESFTRSSDKSIRELLIMIMSWVAQRERENLVERTKAGLDRARAEGKIIGRPRADLNFDEINQLRAEGKSWEDVSEIVKFPVMTIYRARKRKGEVIVGDKNNKGE